MSASWPCLKRWKKNFSVNPVSALTIAMKKITTPNKTCHGAILARVADFAPGNKKEKNPNSNYRIRKKTVLVNMNTLVGRS